jgi:hypothetical protein
MSQAAKFFNDLQKDELRNFIALDAIFKSHEVDTTELLEAFVTYSKQINTLKEVVRKQLEQTTLVDETLGKLNVKVKDDQLKTVYKLAVAAGCYDAADWIQRIVADTERRLAEIDRKYPTPGSDTNA